MSSLRLAAARAARRPQARSLFTASKPVVVRSPVLTGLYATLVTVSAGLFAVYYFDARSAVHRYIITPTLRHLFDAETGHKLAVKVLRSGLGPKDPVADDAILKAKLWDQEISNPVGIAAGFDKEGEAIDGLFNLGFSWVEIGSVTPKPQDGNPKPRVFRLASDEGMINRYGFNSQGHASVLSRLRARIPSFPTPSEASTAAFRPSSLLAVNLGKNKSSSPDSIDDFVAGVRTLGPHADVLVVNVSSPNTPGLRGLQNREVLETLLAGVTRARDELANKPRLVLKLAPDLDKEQLEGIAEVIRASKIDGVIVSNTTIQRPTSLSDPNAKEIGGLSGVPLKPYSLAAVKTLRSYLPSSIPIIGCGGISTGADALEFAKAGASMVQIYTSFGYDGAGACRRVKDQLADALKAEGKTWEQVVDAATKAKSWTAPLPPAPMKVIVPPAQGSTAQLIAEAEELKRLLDNLGDKMGA